MSDPLTTYLMERHATVMSAEKLELMGKSAANALLNEGVSLNQSIVKMASEHPDINHEQVKRVCEYANTAVYLAKHDMSKTAGQKSSYPQFELADPTNVIDSLTSTSKSTKHASVDTDYGRAPERKEKIAHSKAMELLADAFGVEKAAAEVHLTYGPDSAVNEVMGAKTSLVALKDHLSHVGEKLDLMQKEAFCQYYDMVKDHLLEGGDFAGVMAAARSTGASVDKIATVMKPVIEQLLQEKVASSSSLKEGVRRLEKIAHRVLNPTHPLVTTFGAIVELETEIDTVAEGIKIAQVELDRVQQFIKETFLVGTSR